MKEESSVYWPVLSTAWSRISREAVTSDLGLNGLPLCTVPSGLSHCPTHPLTSVLLRCDACVFVLIVSLFKAIEKRLESFQGYSVHEGAVPDGGSTDIISRGSSGTQGAFLLSLHLLPLPSFREFSSHSGVRFLTSIYLSNSF